ncbi:MAG TPA: hypothetical protein VN153_07345 [Tahibacter sp.]|nr:hypothetical protein [Tahibacter sp.]
MSVAALREQLVRLDGLVRRHWNVPFLAEAVDAPATAAPLSLLLALLPEDGAQLGIGGNAFEFVGRRFIDQIQYQFADLDFVQERGGTVFVTQQDFNAVFVGRDGETVWGGLAGGEFHCFGSSLAAFVTCLADCFEISQATFADDVREGDGYKPAFVAAVREAVARNAGASFEGWFEYFYG